MSSNRDPHQLGLDFSSQYHARIMQLSEAVKLIPGGKLPHKYFLHLVLRIEKPAEGLTWSTTMIAEEMLCDRRSVQRITNLLLEAGVLDITERYSSQDSERTNEYRIDWQGVQRLLAAEHDARLSRLGMSRRTAAPKPVAKSVTEEEGISHQERDGSNEQAEALQLVGAVSQPGEGQGGPRQFVTPGRQNVTPGRQIVAANKELLAPSLTLSPRSEPVPVQEPIPDDSETSRKLPQLALEMQDLMQSPDLLAASRRLVTRMGHSATLGESGGPYRALSVQQLNEPATMVRWFRRQLAMPFPVAKGTEAELLVVLAAAKWADELPPAEVKKNRVAAFSWIIRSGNWIKVRKYIPEAVRQLENLAAAKGKFWLEEGD